ncbi:zinc-ribbon domain-containing protein [uncultured Methanobrevibacter sp.]|uniref:zinc-ribbon domain-containing protein n=1 Tax=uncultured Methanobrevibacter sp. TaxID=253161 RepID=UPI002617850E
MKCYKCGEENPPKAKFCGYCGADLENIEGNQNNAKNNSRGFGFGVNNRSGSGVNARSGSRANAGSGSGVNNKSGSNSVKNNKSQTINNSQGSSSQSNNQKKVTIAKQNSFVEEHKTLTCCCLAPIILFAFLIVGVAFMNAYSENISTNYAGEFNYLDSDGDGRLSISEAKNLDTTIPYDNMSHYFESADLNDNGYLKGREYDEFRHDMSKYYSRLEDSSSSSSSKYKYSSSDSGSSSSSSSSSSSNSKGSSSSSYNSDYDSAYELTCPYCGSEAIYETGGYYQCGACGSSIYNPDDLELNYDEGYMDLLYPVISQKGVVV